jgi:hypothetical protein
MLRRASAGDSISQAGAFARKYSHLYERLAGCSQRSRHLGMCSNLTPLAHDEPCSSSTGAPSG